MKREGDHLSASPYLRGWGRSEPISVSPFLACTVPPCRPHKSIAVAPVAGHVPNACDPNAPCLGSSQIEILWSDLSRHEIFDEYYRPNEYSSFDEILSHSYATSAAPKGNGSEPTAPVQVHFGCSNSCNRSGTARHESTESGVTPQSSHMGYDSHDSCRDSGGQHDSMWGLEKATSLLEDVSVTSMGAVQLVLPQGYTNVEEWARKQVHGTPNFGLVRDMAGTL